MKRRTFVSAAAASAICLLAGATAIQAQKVYIDYDKTADLTKYKTFALATTGQDDLSTASPLAHQHILDSLRQKIASNGRLTETKTNPDLYVTYHVTTKEETNVSTMGYGYGYGPGWGGGYYYGGGGWSGATTTVNTYTVGTLLFDSTMPAPRRRYGAASPPQRCRRTHRRGSRRSTARSTSCRRSGRTCRPRASSVNRRRPARGDRCRRASLSTANRCRRRRRYAASSASLSVARSRRR